jgi:hypothetical protein
MNDKPFSRHRLLGASMILIFCSLAILSPAQEPPRVFELFQTTGFSVQKGAHWGAALAAGDIDADGIDEVVTGAPFYDLDDKPQNADAGICRILFGSPTIGSDSTREVLLKPPTPQAFSNYCVSLAMGDLNADGFQDVVVGEPKFNAGSRRDVGRIHIYLGSATFNGSNPITIENPEPVVAGFFGVSLAVGDLNGDGPDDIIVGTPTVNQEKGKIYYYQGSATPKNPPTLTIESPQAEEFSRFGFSFATGDVTGDKIDDLLVSAPWATVQTTTGTPQRFTSAGKVFGFAGAKPFDAKTVATIDNPKPELGALFGLSMAIGDVTGDRIGDLIISAPDMDAVSGRDLASDAGQIFLFNGGVSPIDTKVDATLSFGSGATSTQRLQGSAHLGAPVVAGDFDGDKIDDVIAGAIGLGGFRADQPGRAFVYYGGQGLARPADPNAVFPDLMYQLQQDQAFAQFGRVLAIGDINGDLIKDILFGTPFYDSGGLANPIEDSGEVFLATGFTPIFPTKAKPIR